jgi:hypothetical protein
MGDFMEVQGIIINFDNVCRIYKPESSYSPKYLIIIDYICDKKTRLEFKTKKERDKCFQELI